MAQTSILTHSTFCNTLCMMLHWFSDNAEPSACIKASMKHWIRERPCGPERAAINALTSSPAFCKPFTQPGMFSIVWQKPGKTAPAAAQAAFFKIPTADCQADDSQTALLAGGGTLFRQRSSKNWMTLAWTTPSDAPQMAEADPYCESLNNPDQPLTTSFEMAHPDGRQMELGRTAGPSSTLCCSV